jgi:hypothetical protein
MYHFFTSVHFFYQHRQEQSCIISFTSTIRWTDCNTFHLQALSKLFYRQPIAKTDHGNSHRKIKQEPNRRELPSTEGARLEAGRGSRPGIGDGERHLPGKRSGVGGGRAWAAGVGRPRLAAESGRHGRVRVAVPTSCSRRQWAASASCRRCRLGVGRGWRLRLRPTEIGDGGQGRAQTAMLAWGGRRRWAATVHGGRRRRQLDLGACEWAGRTRE